MAHSHIGLEEAKRRAMDKAAELEGLGVKELSTLAADARARLHEAVTDAHLAHGDAVSAANDEHRLALRDAWARFADDLANVIDRHAHQG